MEIFVHFGQNETKLISMHYLNISRHLHCGVHLSPSLIQALHISCGKVRSSSLKCRLQSANFKVYLEVLMYPATLAGFSLKVTVNSCFETALFLSCSLFRYEVCIPIQLYPMTLISVNVPLVMCVCQYGRLQLIS